MSRKPRRAIDSFGLGYERERSLASTVARYAGFHVGQAVTMRRRSAAVSKHVRGERRVVLPSLAGTISKLVLAPHCKLAVVVDAQGRAHACGLGDLA